MVNAILDFIVWMPYWNRPASQIVDDQLANAVLLKYVLIMYVLLIVFQSKLRPLLAGKLPDLFPIYNIVQRTVVGMASITSIRETYQVYATGGLAATVCAPFVDDSSLLRWHVAFVYMYMLYPLEPIMLYASKRKLSVHLALHHVPTLCWLTYGYTSGHVSYAANADVRWWRPFFAFYCPIVLGAWLVDTFVRRLVVSDKNNHRAHRLFTFVVYLGALIACVVCALRVANEASSCHADMTSAVLALSMFVYWNVYKTVLCAVRLYRCVQDGEQNEIKSK